MAQQREDQKVVAISTELYDELVELKRKTGVPIKFIVDHAIKTALSKQKKGK